MTLTDIFDQYGISAAPAGHEHSRPGWINVDCPFCDLQGHYRMGFAVSYPVANCWACGRHRLIDTLMELTKEPFHVVKQLLDELDVDISVPVKAVRDKLVLPKGLGPLKKAHVKYLEGRGFKTKKLVKLWEIQGIGAAANLQWRIFIPIFHKNQMASWTTRSISNKGVRYITARPDQEVISAKDLLYGEQYCRHSVAVHEGATDVWRVGPGSVATMGTAYSRMQLARVARYPLRIVCFDNEPAAQERARQMADELSVFPGRTLNVCLDAKDPGSASDAEVKKLRALYLE